MTYKKMHASFASLFIGTHDECDILGQSNKIDSTVCIYVRIYNMYCTHFTVNTAEVHSHISITCSNSMRILPG